jgi:hypothetical protein
MNVTLYACPPHVALLWISPFYIFHGIWDPKAFTNTWIVQKTLRGVFGCPSNSLTHDVTQHLEDCVNDPVIVSAVANEVRSGLTAVS